MGKSHVTGIEVGDPSAGIYSTPLLTQSVRLPLELDTPVALHFPEPAIVVGLASIDKLASDGERTTIDITLTKKSSGEVAFTGSTAPAPLSSNVILDRGYYEARQTGGDPGGILILLFLTIVA